MKNGNGNQAAGKAEVLPLEQFLPFLFHLITDALSHRFLERLRPRGVTVKRWRVLMVVMSKGPRNMSELIQLTLIPQSALSRLIDQMERDRLIVRRPSALDSRVVEVELTDHGRQTYWTLVPAAVAHAAAITADFDEKERRQLHLLLRRVLGNLQVEGFARESANPPTPSRRARAAAGARPRRATIMKTR